ncbi:MAG: N-acetylmuramoyl-L-alanine amidase [Rhodobacterales bacterium]|nr:MAG: N-acetylmuramoyl-L-alanine amidase [Rhodobacterales bacterium]PIE09233.1 MAG: N-acetylmuramoyl-L-alanine amidase [Rhodobacterales bacterium]
MIRALLFWLCVLVTPAAADGLSALARLGPDGVELREKRGRIELNVALSQVVPWRVFLLDDPARLVLDFSELDWTGADAAELAGQAERVTELAMGLFRPGWSRMVMALDRPMVVAEAEMAGDGAQARLHLRLEDASAEDFAAAVGMPDHAAFALPPAPPPLAPRRDGPLVIVLDPGHGGIDPGAEREGVRESDLMLRFARELKEVLLRSGRFDVVLTRDADVFVPLEERVRRARAARADVFLSLHADALAQGRASGTTVYTLAEEASDLASQKLAERHARADLLAGIDLSDTDDSVALVLMDLARTETTPRSERLADALVEGIHSATQSTRRQPRLHADFSVLKSPDIPSALVELGFLSTPRDLRNLRDATWRRQAAEGIRDALIYWALEDRALAARMRK